MTPVPSLAPYYAYQALANASFFQVVFMVFYQERAGLPLATVLWVQTYFMALRAALDVPFGALADRTSRRLCLAGGMALLAGASALVVWSPTLPAIAVPLGAFGVVFAATKLVTAAVALRAAQVDDALGARGATIVMAVVGALGLGAMSAASGPAGAAIVLTRGVLDGLWMPLTNV